MSRLLLIALLAVSFESMAAIPRKAPWRPSVESVTEILKLAPEARHVALAQQPDSVYDSLMQIAYDREGGMNLRWRALTSAALLRKEKAVPDLMKASKDQEWFMRNAALVGLAEFSPEKSVEVARRLVKDPALVVRSASVDVLVKHGGAGERELLWKELASNYNRRGGQSLWIRSQIVNALAEKPVDGELAKFSGLLQSEKEEPVQKAAIQGLQALTGMRLGEGLTSHQRVMQLWKNYFAQNPASTAIK